MTAAPLPRPADRIAQVEALASGGFVLVPVPPGTKGPRVRGWNSDPAQWITSPAAAREYLTAHPGAGVGLLHSESQTAALDVDHDGAALALAAVGVDLAALMAGNPYRIRGKRGEKPLWRVPDGLSLRNEALSWPDPSGKKGPGGRPAPLTVFELRGGPVHDILPPSLHPDTGRPYTWAGPVPESVADLPELPPELLRLWGRWGALAPVMRSACPWAPAPMPAPAPRDLGRLGGGAAEGASVIDAFNASRSLGEVLSEHGYQGPPGGPWLYPHSSSGQAGVRLRPERTPRGAPVVMSWHAADPLGDGLPRDAFSVWALLAHGVDLYTATPEARREMVKKAARLLGLPQPQGGSAGGEASAARPAPAPDLPPVAWGDVTPLPPLSEPVPP
ncbi:bifunctional DNA primase/polymerase [Deinococcus murrayi]|uniref:bifunctional DNA primase/polymerase n=1 Tax=Deinococcus murrayi TaxID=68910 RepID=UPI000A03AED9|nr:bifunctional DNA primase/polymerase [Deinococcus murrayi]